MNIDLPENVSFILDKFKENGYLAYAVGGCVRDALLGKTPTDWDICTDALPDDTIKVFSQYKIVETGIKHGTVTLILDSSHYEITTFRTDGDYLDNRHPQSVNFVRNIAKDLARRDFTVNAMAYNKTDGLIDLYGGQSDLGKKIIRCVGEAKTRFSEDALRIMRAVRFSANLDFTIEENTKNAIFFCKNNLNNIAFERINVEFTKTLLSDSATVYKEYGEVFEVFLKGASNFDERFGKNLVKLPKDLETRLSYMLITLNLDSKILENLKYPSKTIKAVDEVIKNFNSEYESIKDLRLLVSRSSYETAHKILTIKSNNTDMLLQVKDMPCKISDLKICGDDLINLGVKDGFLIGKILKELLYIVIDEKCENEKNSLIEKSKILMEELK